MLLLFNAVNKLNTIQKNIFIIVDLAPQNYYLFLIPFFIQIKALILVDQFISTKFCPYQKQ